MIETARAETAASGVASGSAGPDRVARRWIPPRGDIAIAAGLCLLDSLTFAGLPDLPLGFGIAVAVAGYLPLMWRRTYPLMVFAVVMIDPVIAAIWMPEFRPTFNSLLALFTVASAVRLRISLPSLCIAFVVTASTSLVEELRTGTQVRDSAMSHNSIIFFVLPIYAVLCALAWAVGYWARSSRRTVRGLEERRRRAASEAITAERQRVARELHDILSHSVSIIVLQAAGARGMITVDPDRAAQAMTNIEKVGRQSMGELRRLLGVLHDGAIADPEELAALGPQPGLDELPSLVETMRLSGLAVRIGAEGTAAHLDRSVDLSAYRIVQEGLTNSLKHGGPGTTATVTLRWTPDLLTIVVHDDGDGGGDPRLSTGHGIPGLRERARAVGGELEAGACPGGGFELTATLPVSRIKPPVTGPIPARQAHE